MIPMHNYVAIRLDDREPTDVGGLVAIPDRASIPVGTIIGVGPDARVPGIAVGLRALIPAYGVGITYKRAGEPAVRFVLDHEILGLLPPWPPCPDCMGEGTVIVLPVYGPDREETCSRCRGLGSAPQRV